MLQRGSTSKIKRVRLFTVAPNHALLVYIIVSLVTCIWMHVNVPARCSRFSFCSIFVAVRMSMDSSRNFRFSASYMAVNSGPPAIWCMWVCLVDVCNTLLIVNYPTVIWTILWGLPLYSLVLSRIRNGVSSCTKDASMTWGTTCENSLDYQNQPSRPPLVCCWTHPNPTK